MAAHPPDRSLYDATQWNLDVIRYADELGYSEAWLGEHHTVKWEPIPSPDLLIAQAIPLTKRIKLAVGAFILPYYHPLELAHRIVYLDHLAQGRFITGIGAGSVISDLKMFNIDPASGENRKMTEESLEIMLKVWTEREPFEYKGNYWTVVQGEDGDLHGPHLYPLQKPFPPIGISGVTKGSGTLKLAGEHGFLPMSFGFNDEVIKSHWDAVLEGAKRSGKTPDRNEWRIQKDVFVAETDEEAYELSVNRMMGRFYRECQLPNFERKGMLSVFKQQPDMSDHEVTVQYLAQQVWLVGSPDTVARKLDRLYETVGGFGTLLVSSYDYSEHPEAWKKSMRLLQEEVLPRMKVNRKKGEYA